MKRLRDIAKIGSIKDVKDNLDKTQRELHSVGASLYSRHDLDVGCRVYPAIAKSTADQLKLLAKLIEEPIEITANICRTVFEINIVFRYCLSSKERLDAFADQSATDEISILKAIKSLANKNTNSQNLIILDERINQIRSSLVRHGRMLKPDRASISEMAKEIGLKEEYSSMYGIYSKYVHASAWFILRQRDHIDLPMLRIPMQLHTQLYAADTLFRLQELDGK